MAHLLNSPSLFIHKDFLEHFRRYFNPKTEKWKEHEKLASFPCKGMKSLRIYSWYSLPDFKYDEKHFTRILSLIFPEMRHFGTFQSILSNGYHGNGDRYKNFYFSFRPIFLISMTVKSSLPLSDRKKCHIFCF